MIRDLVVENRFLAVPIYGGEKELDDLKLFLVRDPKGNIIWKFLLPWKEDMTGEADYKASLDTSRLIGQRISIETEMPGEYLDKISFTEEESLPQDPNRPRYHYTAPYGWINDPNGMVYADGVWHLYYQHNPMDTRWANMSWGHAISKDLKTFTYVSDVMYADQHGMMFSGCGIRNERGCFGLPKEALLFFYTASHDPTRLGKGIDNTQRMAYSLDGGRTLTKYEDWFLPTLAPENRDPKIFWHEPSQAYIMVLYMDKWTFAIFRSADLKEWTKTQEISQEPMWECPDLVELKGDYGDRKWAFLSADGYYMIGDFDGYTFTARTEMLSMYGDKIPYAAQSFSGSGDRVIQIAWLRIPNRNRLYTGAMGIPRELSLGRDEKGYFIKQQFAIVNMLENYKSDSGVTIDDSYIHETISPDGRTLYVTIDE